MLHVQLQISLLIQIRRGLINVVEAYARGLDISYKAGALYICIYTQRLLDFLNNVRFNLGDHCLCWNSDSNWKLVTAVSDASHT